MRTREEHVQWCKDQAMAYVRSGDLLEAVTSMACDMGKHPETECNVHLLMLGTMYAEQYDREGVIRWINGFRS
jgi:hypothetical protein